VVKKLEDEWKEVMKIPLSLSLFLLSERKWGKDWLLKKKITCRDAEERVRAWMCQAKTAQYGPMSLLLYN
jgi:hypothetical protein